MATKKTIDRANELGILTGISPLLFKKPGTI